jgi:hypothetical protein
VYGTSWKVVPSAVTGSGIHFPIHEIEGCRRRIFNDTVTRYEYTSSMTLKNKIR